MTRVNILLGGPKRSWPRNFKQFVQKSTDPWLGVDRGAHRLLALGKSPKIALGDFDSLNPAELKNLQSKINDIRYAIPEKDDTDSELALLLAMEELQADEIYLYGATDGRIDHFLVNLFMILEPRFLPIVEHVKLIDAQNTIQFFKPGKHQIKKEFDKKYLAFIPLILVSNLELFDEKYQLGGVDFSYPRSLASNEFVGEEANFAFTSGIVCVIQSTDRKFE